MAIRRTNLTRREHQKEGDLPVSGEDWTQSQGREGSMKGVPKAGRCRRRGDPKEGKDPRQVTDREGWSAKRGDQGTEEPGKGRTD